MIEEIARGVFVQRGSYAQGNRALVCGRQWCVLIDAPMHFDEADELRKLAGEKTVGGVWLAVITHGHLDHVATLQAFPGATVVSTWASRDYMQHRGQEELDRLKEDDEELQQIQQVLPSVTFSGEGMVYDDVGRSLRCIPAPGHSQDSQMVLLEPEGIIFGGDTLSPVVPPYFPDGSSTRLQESICRLANTDADTLVPGHGPILRGEAIEHEAGEAVRYLENLRRLVREGVEQGKDPNRLQEEITWQECSQKPAPPEEFLKYHRENLANMAREISEEMTALKAGPAWHV